MRDVAANCVLKMP